MKSFKNFILIIFLFFNFNQISYSEVPFFLDFKYILNNSDAGKKAQDQLKKKLESGIKNINSKQKKLQEEEKKIIQQKKLLALKIIKKKSLS